jgi:hypothetical protein
MNKKAQEHADFREVFSVDAVEARFKKLGFKAVRGTYFNHTGCACLLGSFEHAMLGLSESGDAAPSLSNLPTRIVRMLEAGWEQLDLDNSDLLWRLSDKQCFSELNKHAVFTAEELEAYEWGLALGNIFVGPARKNAEGSLFVMPLGDGYDHKFSVYKGDALCGGLGE